MEICARGSLRRGGWARVLWNETNAGAVAKIELMMEEGRGGTRKEASLLLLIMLLFAHRVL